MSVATSVSYIDISDNEPDSVQARINTKSIAIPAFVVEIADNSFENSIVESITFMGDSQLKTIGKAAFKNCKFLKSIKIPPSVVEIADEAFFGSSLEEILFTHDSQLKTIDKGVFRYCKILKSITIPASATCVGSNSFQNCAIEKVRFGDNSQCATIDSEAFRGCYFLNSIEIPSSVVVIGESAFSESGIKEVHFPDNSNLTTIEKSAFHQARLSKCIEIPDSVVMIAYKAFAGCDKLEEVIFSVNSQLETIGEAAFLKCRSLKSFHFPHALREIGSSAFSFCSLPKSITLSSPSVEFLGDPFTKSGVNEIIFANGETTQTTEKNNHFLQLCKEGNFSKCVVYLAHNDVNLFYTKSDDRYWTLTFDAISIAMTAKNVDLIIFLIKNKALMYSNCQTQDIKKCFTDDIFERVFFESATVFWFSIFSFAMRKMYNVIRRLLKLLRSKEYVEEWVNIFRNFYQITPLQCVTQGDSFELYHFLIDYDLVKVADLEVDTIKKYFQLTFKFGNVALLKKYLEILPVENISFKFTDFLMRAPQDNLYSLVEYTLPYIIKDEGRDPFGLIVEAEYKDEEYVKFPETVLSYLAYAQAFDAFKYIIENVPNTQYTPSHLVACSLFRGYNDAKLRRNVDIRNFMKLFDYILQDDIRPHILGEDKEWVGKSIFTCIEYGSSEMCLKLFSYGFDKDDVYIDVISDEDFNSLIRYSLLSYACRYQSLEVVRYLIDMGVSVDGLLPNHINNSSDSNKNDQSCIDVAVDDEDGIEIESESNDKYLRDDEDDDEDDDDDESEARNDVANPTNFFFSNMRSIKNAWFEPYFNPYRLNKNQDVEIYYSNSRPFDPSTEDPFERFQEHHPFGYLTLLNVTPLGIAIYAQNLDLVRLLLNNGANSNASTFSGFPHLFALDVGGVIDLDHKYSRKRPEVEYPVVDILSDMGDNKEENQLEEEQKGKKMKMKHKSKDEDVSASISVPNKYFAIFQELVNYGVDLFHEQTVYYATDSIESREFDIYDLCAHLKYPLDLLKYLQTIPQLADKVKGRYIKSFRSTIIYNYGRPSFSVDTVDYMFQNGYLHFETYNEDDEFHRGIQSIVEYNQDWKLVLEKYGFHFANLATE